MKKIIKLFIAVLLCFSITACGNSSKDNDKNSDKDDYNEIQKELEEIGFKISLEDNKTVLIDYNKAPSISYTYNKNKLKIIYIDYNGDDLSVSGIVYSNDDESNPISENAQEFYNGFMSKFTYTKDEMKDFAYWYYKENKSDKKSNQEKENKSNTYEKIEDLENDYYEITEDAELKSTQMDSHFEINNIEPIDDLLGAKFNFAIKSEALNKITLTYTYSNDIMYSFVYGLTSNNLIGVEVNAPTKFEETVVWAMVYNIEDSPAFLTDQDKANITSALKADTGKYVASDKYYISVDKTESRTIYKLANQSGLYN